MKIENILRHESSNESSIILFKEGIFLRAYERSAMRFTEHLERFKVFKKHYKVVNSNVCYLGFPYKTLPILLQKHNITKFTETEYYVVLFNFTSDTNFEQWKNSIELPTMEDLKPQILLREPVRPKDMINLRIYKTGYDIMLELHRLVENLPREHKYSVGERIKSEAVEMGLAAYRVGMEKNIPDNKCFLVGSIETLRLLLRMLKDLKVLSLKYFTAVNVRMEELYLALGR